jgi:RNA polymerase sigma factor (sigma-70 family)
MARARFSTVLGHIHALAGAPAEREWADVELLRRFVDGRDEAAFRALVDRHGRLVFGVCRQVLRQRQDAEDAFQATFLVLARKAGSIRAGAALSGWLYRVAFRIANELRRAADVRRWHERRAKPVARSEADLGVAWQELQAVLAEEVSRLLETFRAPFVLCCLEGHSKEEAAARLGWKVGSVSWRLSGARRRLQQRLARRGLTLEDALCAAAQTAARFPSEPGGIGSTIAAASSFFCTCVLKSVKAAVSSAAVDQPWCRFEYTPFLLSPHQEVAPCDVGCSPPRCWFSWPLSSSPPGPPGQRPMATSEGTKRSMRCES